MTFTPAPKPETIEIDHKCDGIDHINVYTRGATSLGRALSNLYECNIEHPYFGHFRTLEGLWFYMKTGFRDDSFRLVRGAAAREQGKRMETEFYPLFSKMFKLGMLEKLERNPNLQQELVANELPLMHYYVYQGKLLNQTRHQWQLDYWALLRTALKTTGSLASLRAELEDEIKYHLENPRELSRDTEV